jgi:hypothetical protein
MPLMPVSPPSRALVPKVMSHVCWRMHSDALALNPDPQPCPCTGVMEYEPLRSGHGAPVASIRASALASLGPPLLLELPEPLLPLLLEAPLLVPPPLLVAPPLLAPPLLVPLLPVAPLLPPPLLFPSSAALPSAPESPPVELAPLQAASPTPRTPPQQVARNKFIAHLHSQESPPIMPS